MNFLKKGVEFMKLGKAFNAAFIRINELELEINTKYMGFDNSQLHEDIVITAYIFRKEIIDRIETYEWSMNAPLLIPSISNKRVTVLFAFQQTVGRLLGYADSALILDDVNEIFEKGDSFYKVESIILKKMNN